MNLQKLFFAAVIVLSANAGIAQSAQHNININIPQVALLNLKVATGNTDITLVGTAPTVAGDPMTFGAAATNATIWMNYSSIVKGALLRNVGVAITSGTVPAGLKLTVLAGADAATGAGTMGAASTVLTLSATSQNIVTGIGSAYTGTGATKGRNLTYNLNYATGASTDYAALKFFDTAVPLVITYTLSDGL